MLTEEKFFDKVNEFALYKNTNDALTHSARIYELTRINNLNLKIS